MSARLTEISLHVCRSWVSDCVCMPIITTFVIRHFFICFDFVCHTRRRGKMTILCFVLFSALLFRYAVIAFYYIPQSWSFYFIILAKKKCLSAPISMVRYGHLSSMSYGVLSYLISHIDNAIFFYNLVLTSRQTFPSRFPALVDVSNILS